MDPQFGSKLQLASLLFTILFGYGPIALVILFGLLVPGRKGTMRTQREATFESIDAESLRGILLGRLARFGFSKCVGQVPGQLSASRPKRQLGRGATEVHTHASKPLEMEIRVESTMEASFRVIATVGTPDLVFLDTGEGSHIDQCLEYLLQAVEDPLPEMPAPVPNLTMKASTSLAGGILMTIAAPALMLPWFTLPRAIGFMAGIGIGALVGVVLGALGLLDTIRRPHEIRGRRVAFVGIVLTLVGLGLALALFVPVHGPAIMEWLRAHPNPSSPG